MYSLLFFLFGLVIGVIVSNVSRWLSTGRGFFKLEKVPDEEDFYKINVRLLPDQKLNKKKHIILTRE